MNNFNKNRSSTRQSPKQAGYSLIFAVLISATLVTIGAAMANLALKEFAIVGTSRASQAAFYAADAGMECALYYDFQGGPHFREPYECDSNSLACAPMTQIRCDEQDIGVSVYNDIGTVNTMSRLGDRYRVYNEFEFNYNNSACVQVRILKTDWGDETDLWDGKEPPRNGPGDPVVYPEPDGYNGPGLGTVIEARGRNVRCSGDRTAIQVERALRVDY